MAFRPSLKYSSAFQHSAFLNCVISRQFGKEVSQMGTIWTGEKMSQSADGVHWSKVTS